VLAEAAPLKVTVAPAPPVIVPEMEYVTTVLAMKLTPAMLALVTVTDRFAGVNASPVPLGVRVYEPLSRLEKVYAPEPSAIWLPEAVPLKVTVAPAPPLMLPEFEYLGARALASRGEDRSRLTRRDGVRTVGQSPYRIGCPELNRVRCDTVLCPPGQVTRIITPFMAEPGRFVWHCHMLEHEDNEMMRPYVIQPASHARTRL
jgi:hypothetical protein